MTAATAARKQLLRQLEGRIRQGVAITETRWQLRDTGMTADELWAFELPIRRRIREERAGRKNDAPAAALARAINGSEQR